MGKVRARFAQALAQALCRSSLIAGSVSAGAAQGSRKVRASTGASSLSIIFGRWFCFSRCRARFAQGSRKHGRKLFVDHLWGLVLFQPVSRKVRARFAQALAQALRRSSLGIGSVSAGVAQGSRKVRASTGASSSSIIFGDWFCFSRCRARFAQGSRKHWRKLFVDHLWGLVL